MPKIINLFFPGPFGGAEKVILKGLKELQIDTPTSLWIVKESRCPEHAEYFEKECDKAQIHTKSFVSNGVLDFKLIKELKSLLPKDYIVHAHGMKASFYASLLPNKLIITHHGHTSHTLKVRFYEFIQERIMKKANAVIAVSTTMHDELKSKNIESTLIENMLSIKPVERHSSNKDRPHFIFIGRLSPEKGADVLVKALKDLHHVDVSIIGDGSQKQMLDQYIKEEEIKHIKLLGFHSDITSFIQNADALIMPSLREGLPMTLLEAICSGVPVIGSEVGGLKSLIKHNGILVPAGDPNALKKAVEYYLLKKEIFSENAIVMKDEFIKRFSVEYWCKKTKDIYNKVLSHC